MAGLSSADIFSILEREIGKKEKGQRMVDPDAGPEIVIDSSSDSGTIVHGCSSTTGGNNIKNRPVAHDFVKTPDAHFTPKQLPPSNKSQISPDNSGDVTCAAVLSPEGESSGKKMKKTLRIRQMGEQIRVRVFVNNEELCGVILAKGTESSISLAGVNLFIDGEETVLEV